MSGEARGPDDKPVMWIHQNRGQGMWMCRDPEFLDFMERRGWRIAPYYETKDGAVDASR